MKICKNGVETLRKPRFVSFRNPYKLHNFLWEPSMKNLIVAAFISVLAISAQAGSITFEAPQDTIIEIEPNFGIGGSWIVPVVIIAVMALVIAKPAGNIQ